MAYAAPQGQWQSGICGLFDDGGICCIGCLATPCLYADTKDRHQGGGCCGAACGYAILSMCCLQALIAQQNRRTLRAKFNLQEEPCGDCCVHCFCSPCAVCQEARELKRRGVACYAPPPGQFVTTPGQYMQGHPPAM